MNTATIIITLSLIVIAVLLIAYPLWKQTRPEAMFKVTRTGQTLEEYEARYQALLAAIKDLMFDYEMGKVSVDDYNILLEKTKLEAADVRREIDRLSQAADLDNISLEMDAEIEAMIAQARQAPPADIETVATEVDAEIELLKTVHLIANDNVLKCPHCGKSTHPDDVFCSGCGQPLSTPQAKQDDTDTCPQCGSEVQPNDVFCAKCGASLKPQVASAVKDVES